MAAAGKDDPNQVINTQFSKKLTEEIHRIKMVVCKSYRVSQNASIVGQTFTIDDFEQMDLRSLIHVLGLFMPIVRLVPKPDSYLLGAEIKSFTVRNNSCQVFDQGRFFSVQDYYD